MRQLFVSHNKTDAELARRLVAELQAERPDDQFRLSSQHDLGPVGGTQWEAWIRNVVTNCDIVLFIASEHSQSVWCSAELGMARLLGKPILPLHTGSVVAASPLVSHIQIDPLDQPAANILRLIDNRLGPPSGSLGELKPGFVPYPGLDPLAENQAPLLFGRDPEIRRLLSDFNPFGEARLMILSGPSGSGKSSLARAGLMPRLRRDGWELLGPLQPRQLSEDGLPAVSDERPLAILVDQAEELLLLGDEQRAAMVTWLNAALESGVWVLLVVREEFRSDVRIGLPKPIDHYVPFLGRDELYEIIRGPAKLATLGIEEGLVDRLVGETGSGEALPLLALTMHELWKQRDTADNQLTERTLDELGGVKGVMTGLAQEALHAATDGDPLLTDPVLAVLTRLTTPDHQPPTRSPVRIDSLSDQQRTWLDAFADVGLVAYRTSYDLDDRLDAGVRPTGDDLADVTHEALLAWKPLADAIGREREDNVQRQSIERVAARWDEGGRNDKTLLLAGDRLVFARVDGLADLPGLLQDFVSASERNDRERQVRRWLVAGIAVASVFAVVAAVVAFVQRNEASEERDAAQAAQRVANAAELEAREAEAEAVDARQVARSVRLAAQAVAATSDERDFALLAAVAAHGVNENPDTEAALFSTLASPVGPVRYFSNQEADWSTLRILDRDRGLVAGAERRLSIVEFTTGDVNRLGQGTTLDEVGIVEAERVPNSVRVVFRGRHDSGGWAAGIFDFATGEVLSVTHPQAIRSVTAGPTLLVYGDVDGVVLTADITTEGLGPPQELDRHQGEITDLAIDRSEQNVAVASVVGLRLHQRGDGGEVQAVDLVSVPAGARTLERVAFRRDKPDELYAVGTDPAIHRWTIDGNSIEAEIIGSHIGGVESISIVPDRALLITAGRSGAIQRWDLDRGAEIGQALPGHRQATIGLSTLGGADSELVVSADAEVGILWNLAPAREIQRPAVIPLEWRDLSVTALVGGGGPLAVVTTDGRVVTDDGRELEAPTGVWQAWWTGDDLAYEIRNIARPMDGVSLWTLVDTELRQVADSLAAVDVGGCLAVLAGESSLAYRGIGLCDTPFSGIDFGEDGGRGFVTSVALSPDQTRVAVSFSQGLVEIVSVVDGARLDFFRTTEPEVITALHWLTEKQLVVGHDIGGATEIVDLSTQLTWLLPAHDDAVRFISSNRDGSRLFLGSEDARISHSIVDGGPRILTTFGTRIRQKENDDEATVFGLRWLEESSTLLSVQGSRIAGWELEPGRLVELACERAGRDLSPQEASSLGLDPFAAVC